MKLKEEILVPYPRKAVWDTFDDLEVLISCFPGATLISAEAGGVFRGKVALKLGPMRMQFTGSGEIVRDPAFWRGEVKGKGNDRNSNSRVVANMKYELVEGANERETLVRVEVDYSLFGSLAQVGRGPILEEFIRHITADFGAALNTKINNTAGEMENMTEIGPSHRPILIGSIVIKTLYSLVRKYLVGLFVK